MKLIIIIISLLLFVSCDKKTENQENTVDIKEAEVLPSKTTFIDASDKKYPISIGNDKGFVKIIEIKTYEKKELTDSHFIITLNDIPNVSFSKELNADTLRDPQNTNLYKDSLAHTYVNDAILTKIEFDFVRSNTLYFNAVLENPTAKKEIIGRFSLFYASEKKGKPYGWITDNVK